MNYNYTEEILKYKRNKKLKGIFIGVGILLLAIIGSTYAFFTYSKSLLAFTLTSSGITASFSSGSNQINITNGYPISDEFALQNLNQLDYIDFTVSGNVEDENQGLTYEIYLTEKDSNTLDPNYIKIYLTDENGQMIKTPKVYNYLNHTSYSKDASLGKLIYNENGVSGNYTKSFRIYAWIDKDYEQNIVQEEFSFYVNLYAYNDENKEGSVLIQKKIAQLKEENPSCNYVIEDYDTNNNLEVTYLSGSAPGKGNCAIDFNYVWWSGKMWRITAIYPDGAMKMITDNSITIIPFGETLNFYDNSTGDKSYAFQWLNEDFLDTLYNNGEDVIDKTKSWNVAITDVSTIEDKPSVSQDTSVSVNVSPVGLLNSYEYCMSYKTLGNCNSSSNYRKGYLVNGYHWVLMNPTARYNSLWVVAEDGSYESFSFISPPNISVGIRPTIYVKSGIRLYGSGTKENPYKLSVDFENASYNDKINTRHSGEYIKFKTDINNSNLENAPLYRIINIEGENNSRTTKILAMNYLYYNDGEVISYKKRFCDTSINGNKWGNYTTDDGWYYYFHGINGEGGEWYQQLSFKDKITKGLYYLGTVAEYGVKNYKYTVCNSTNFNPNQTIKECIQNNNIALTWYGLIGTVRYGEMFATRHNSEDTDLNDTMWTITPRYRGVMWGISILGSFDNGGCGINLPIRPTYHLKPSVKILSGSGTELDPYIVD